MTLTPDVTLRRVPELLVEVESSHRVRVHHDRRIWEFGPHALSLLDVFYEPVTVAEALQRLRPRLKGRRAVDELLTTLTTMAGAGLLTPDPAEGHSELMFPIGGYGQTYLDVTMLEDPVRKPLFLKAIDEVVGPDDVVLDLGTGCGVLAVAAARAGARHVYAVEPARTGDIAARVVERNGFADRVTIVRGWSSTTELPEKATVLTTDIIGNDGLDMVIWENLQDARRRLLSDDARLIPGSLRARIYLAHMPAGFRSRHRILPAHIMRWQSRYGIDFAPMLEGNLSRSAGFYERPEHVRDWEPLSEPVPLFTVDLHQDVRHFENEVSVPVTRAGLCNTALVYFEAQLGPTTVLSTAPWDGGEKSHWYCAGWAFPEELKVAPGDMITLSYRYEGDGRARVELVQKEEEL
ncbi:50S ribosomal protein L11 methyltransferase [Nonomuraea fuscirosea]|uniref:50S ribosomal protein L11 methyltransferase n=1 Tax=Nonomuraea fuscirosea TaxID=1291556 RepID=UPI00341D95C6